MCNSKQSQEPLLHGFKQEDFFSGQTFCFCGKEHDKTEQTNKKHNKTSTGFLRSCCKYTFSVSVYRNLWF